MPDRQHYRTPSTAGLIRRVIRLFERQVSQLERHYDALEAGPGDDPPGAGKPRRQPRSAKNTSTYPRPENLR